MANKSPGAVHVETFADYQVITQPNPLRAAVRRLPEELRDDPVARAEQALSSLSGQFEEWMRSECDRLTAAHSVIVKNGFSKAANSELFRAAHDIKGDAPTFGYPVAAAAADSLCRILEHAPSLDSVPTDLIGHHVNAINAIVREHNRLAVNSMAGELSRKLRKVADDFLIAANRDRPEHLEAILAPSIVPGD